jgi:hypothetical protein
VKSRVRLVTLSLLLSIVLISTIVVTQPVAAGDRNSEHVMFNTPTLVGGTVLEPGTYNVIWEGPGPHVQVTFEKGLKTVLTVGAEFIAESSPYDGAIVTRTREDKTKVLEKIRWKNKALVFVPTA